MKDYTYVYIPKWKIKGFPNYAFTVDKKLFNYKTNRFSKKRVKNYSVGYTLNGKFYTLQKLKKITSLIGTVSNNNLTKSSVQKLYNYLIAA
ncbi:hypothetical protein ACFQZW_12945 [Lutibacter aestuarii]|uniref:Uncharacterized protein n=1 Tax=Lutibacter aestuarii TaxID=861111 RepID=A0ABW2Z844_9FLAO